jgi:hypothetical protein
MTQIPADFPQPPGENVGLAGIITWLLEVLRWYVARAAARAEGEDGGWTDHWSARVLPWRRARGKAGPSGEGGMHGPAAASAGEARPFTSDRLEEDRSLAGGEADDIPARPPPRAPEADLGERRVAPHKPQDPTGTVFAAASEPGRALLRCIGAVAPPARRVHPHRPEQQGARHTRPEPRAERTCGRPHTTAGPIQKTRGLGMTTWLDHFVAIS